jgi:hypothetical protein
VDDKLQRAGWGCQEKVAVALLTVISIPLIRLSVYEVYVSIRDFLSIEYNDVKFGKTSGNYD